MRARMFVACALTAALLPCFGCGEDRAPAGPPRGNIVRIHLPQDPASLTMIGKTDVNSEIVAMRLTDALVQYDSRLEMQPLLATSWSLSEDGRTLTFHLREGVRWHDGTPVTAADVLFTIGKLRQPETENRTWAPEFRKLTSLEAPDEHTVVAVYEETTPDLLDGWRVPILPAHLAGADEDFFNGPFSRRPVGCGPFRFVSYVRGQGIVLEANDDYWGGRPRIDGIEFKIFSDQQTAYQALLTGDLDIMTMSSNLWMELEDDPRAERLARTQYKRFTAWVIGYNLREGSIFRDVRVRLALLHALDRESFLKNVAHGMAHLGATTFPPASPWADPSIEPWGYDPERARELLAEAGWTDSDGDGVLDRDGEPFAFSLYVPAGPQQLTEWIAAWQQESWRKLGADVNFEQIEWQTFRQRRGAGEFDLVEQSLHFTSPDMYPLYHSAEAGGGLNFWGLEDPDIDAALEAIRRTFDPRRRLDEMHALQRLLHEREPLTALFFFNSPLVYDRRLVGVTPSPLGYANTVDGPRRWAWSDDGGR